MDSYAFVSAAFVTCCHLCRLIGFTLWGFVCIVAAFTAECLEQAAFPSCSRCLCQGVPVTGDYDHKGLFIGDCYCRVLCSWGTVHRAVFTGDGVMEDFLHRLLCSQRTVFMGTVYGEHVELLLENMPNAFCCSTHSFSVSSIMSAVLNHKGEAVLRGNL